MRHSASVTEMIPTPVFAVFGDQCVESGNAEFNFETFGTLNVGIKECKRT